MATGIDTLASQAFGAKNSRLVGVVFARGTLLTALIFFVPVTILWYYMGTVVLMLGEFFLPQSGCSLHGFHVLNT